MSIEVHTTVDGTQRLVGHLYAQRRRNVETSTFAYADSWVGQSGAFALEPALPVVLGPLATPAGRALPGSLSDSAPDGWGRALIRRRERRRADTDGDAARSFGEVDLLLGVRDDLRQGALRFRHAEAHEFPAPADAGVPALLDLPRLLAASRRAERDLADDEDLSLLLRAGSSLGGARPKTHVRARDGKIGIARFPSARADGWNVMAWEWVALTLAARAGIRVSEATLESIDGRSVLILIRFDRSGTERIGYVSAMTMVEATDGDTRSYLEIADVIQRLSPSPDTDLRELFRRIAFSILIRNTDDHLRNHGFLHAGGDRWRLAPAFDLNPDPSPGVPHLSTAIDFDETAARIDVLLDTRDEYRLTAADARTIVLEVAASTSGWARCAHDVGITADEIDLMRPTFESAEVATARRL